METRRILDMLSPGGALAGRLFADLVGDGRQKDILPAGTVVDVWMVKSVLGRGGSSVVYLAERCGTEFHQQVALKVVQGDPESTESMLSELKILAELRHPGIARLIDGGRLEQGRCWFAMEPVFGKSVDTHLAESALSWRQRVQLFVGICDAVAYAHSRQLVHRDIKPSNILVDEHGIPRVLDFGIATRDGEGGEERRWTPGYESPEQRKGLPVTAASDTYQLGRLFEQLMDEDLPNSTLRLPRATRRELAAIIAMATAEEPTNRYLAVAVLRDDLTAVLQSRPVIARGSAPAYRLGTMLRRHPGVSLLALAALLVAATLIISNALHLRKERTEAEQAALAAGATSDFVMNLFSSGDENASSAGSLTADDILARGVQRLERELSDQPAAQAAAALEIARVYDVIGENSAADPFLRRQLELARATLPVSSTGRIKLLLAAGWNAHRLGRYEEAEKHYAEADRGLILGEGDAIEILRGTLMHRRAVWFKRQGDLDTARRLQREAIDVFTRRNADNSVGAAWNNLGAIELEANRLQDAESALETAFAIHVSRHGALDPAALSTQGNLAMVRRRLGKYASAEATYQSNLGGLEQVGMRLSREFATANQDFANLRYEQGNYDECRRLARTALQVYAEVLGSGHGENAFPLTNIARASVGRGDFVTAMNAYTQVLELRRDVPAKQRGLLLRSLISLSSIRMEMGQQGEAFSDWREAMAMAYLFGAADTTTIARMDVVGAQVAIANGNFFDAHMKLDAAQWRLGTSNEQQEWLGRIRRLRVAID
jgi:eukaryotic-like serine/threonine-protein kinase